MKHLMTGLLLAAQIGLPAFADTFGTGANQFSIDFVDIGYGGNQWDSTTGYGAVNYNYRMGKYEITIDQFMKARAADSRIGDGDENYWNSGVRSAGIIAPAGKVNWLEAAMFCNWLSSGDALTGVYQFAGGGGLSAIDRSYRNGSGLAYVIPSEDEWYKAAYYRPINNGSYSAYASGLDSDPVHGTANGWNYVKGLDYAVGGPNYVWEAGFGAQEQNGTFDMTGNVWEWTESEWDADIAPDWVVLRGGGYSDNKYGIEAENRDTGSNLEYEAGDFGFRVAAIPEPSSVLLLTIGSGGLLFYRRAKRRRQDNHITRRKFQ